MLTNVVKKLWSMRVQFAKYFTIGIGAVVLDIWSLHFLVNLHINPILSIVINQLVIINLVFLLNKYWAFGSKGVTHQQIIRFYLVAGFNYLFAIAWMYIFTSLINLHQYIQYIGISQTNYYLVVRLINVAMAVSWNFLLYKFFVYRQEVGDVNKLAPDQVS